MQSASVLVLSAWVVCVSLSAQQPTGKVNGPQKPSTAVYVENGELSVSVRDQPLQLVSEEITGKTHVNIVVAEGLGSDLISREVRAAKIDVAVRELFDEYDTILLYGGSKNVPSTLRTVWVLPKGGGSEMRPLRFSDCAATRELEAQVADANPVLREAAYQALLERPDQKSKNTVVDAIKGLREREAHLRERLLSSAISKGFPVPTELLVDLVRTDASEHIRWMALDALSGNAAVDAIAELATADVSEPVRTRARQILDERKAGGDAAAEDRKIP